MEADPAKFSAALQAVVAFQQQIAAANIPWTDTLYPVTVGEGQSLLVHVFDADAGAYQPVFWATAPMPLPPGVMAAFPLEPLNGKMSCVVTPQIFAYDDGNIIIFHEFLHCRQFETVEPGLKASLSVAREAMQSGNYMWEVQYPFPYTDPQFVETYQGQLAAQNVEDIIPLRRRLKETLKLQDYEYLLWQEWKEGLARYIENQMRSAAGLALNNNGSQPPFERVSFYAGGAHLIDLLAQQKPELLQDMKDIFAELQAMA